MLFNQPWIQRIAQLRRGLNFISVDFIQGNCWLPLAARHGKHRFNRAAVLLHRSCSQTFTQRLRHLIYCPSGGFLTVHYADTNRSNPP